jgi:hypothetical protein
VVDAHFIEKIEEEKKCWTQVPVVPVLTTVIFYQSIIK